jgi:hypothetical protein
MSVTKGEFEMNCGLRRRTLRATALGCCVSMSLYAAQAAADISIDADVGGEYSDNVGRTATDEQSDTIGTARLGIGIEELRPRLEARVNGNLGYRHYFDNSFDNEIVGGLSGDLAWSILPERFIWVVEDNYGQIAANRAVADTPANRQDFNYFTTGPDLRLPLGERTFTEISARWSDVYYEDVDGEVNVPSAATPNQGSENIEGSVALGRVVSDQTTVSLNGQVQEIAYDDSEFFDDYRITSGFGRWESQGRQTQLSVDAGYSEAKRGDDKSGGVLARLHLSREITSRSTVSLDVGSEFADTASAFRIDQTAGGVAPEADDTVAAGDVFRTTYAYLRFGTERERTTVDVVFNGRRERHESEIELDRDALGAGFVLSRRITPRMDLEFRASYTDEDFVTTDFAFNEWSVGSGVAWRMTNRLSLRLTVDHFKGSSDGDPGQNLGAREYEENRAFLGLRYSSRRR